MTQQEITGLIKRSLDEDQQAFRKLVEKHQQMVFRLAFRLLCNSEEAKDIVQETFIRVWRNLNRYDVKQKFSTWLFKIVTNLCYDKLKSTKYKMNNHNVDLEHVFVSGIASKNNVETELINNELISTIKTLTKRLTPKQKIVFTLRDLEGLEMAEVVSITGQNAKKIKSNLYLARKQIREGLEEYDKI